MADIDLNIFDGASVDGDNAYLFDPVIELGVSEIISATPWVSLTFNRYVNAFEIITTGEYADIIDGRYFIDIFEHTFVTEFRFIRNILLLSAFELTLIVDEEPGAVSLRVGWGTSRVSVANISEFVQMGLSEFDLEVEDTVLASYLDRATLGPTPFDLPIVFDSLFTSSVFYYDAILDLSFNAFVRSYPFNETIQGNIAFEQFENGAEQRRDKWGRVKRKFFITFSPRSKSEIDAIKEFYVSYGTSAKAFNFVSPLDGITYKVRFEMNTLEVSRIAYGIYSASVSIIEVF